MAISSQFFITKYNIYVKELTAHLVATARWAFNLLSWVGDVYTPVRQNQRMEEIRIDRFYAVHIFMRPGFLSTFCGKIPH